MPEQLPDVQHAGEVHVYRYDQGRMRSLVMLGVLLGVAPFLVALGLALVLPPTERLRTPGIIAGFIVGALIFWSLLAFVALAVRRIAIITSSAGITYRHLGYRISARWEDVVRLGAVPAGVTYGEGLILRGSGLHAPRWLAGMLRANRADEVIPLSTIQWWWRDSQLGNDLRRFAPWLFDPAVAPATDVARTATEGDEQGRSSREPTHHEGQTIERD